MLSVESFGANFLVPLDWDAGGVRVCELKASSKNDSDFRGVTFVGERSLNWLWVAEYGPGEEGSWAEISTAGSWRLG